MAMTKSTGSGESEICIKVEMSAQGSGRVTTRLPDGSEVERKGQTFVRIDKEHLVRGDWLLNVLTGEIHRVLDVMGTQVKLQTQEGFIVVPWDDLPDTLQLVINP